MLRRLFSRVAGEKSERSGTGVEHPIRILLVDDNKVNRQVVKGHVETLGYPVEAVADVETAIGLFPRLRPAAVLICCRDSGLDGAGIARRLSALRGAGSEAFLVGLLEGSQKDEREKYLLSGLDELLDLPVRAETLARVLGERIRKPGGGQRREESATAPDAIVDRSLLMRWVDDDPKLLQGTVPLLIDDLDGSLARVDQGLRDDDGAVVSLGTQSLRSIAASIGAAPLDMATRRLEELVIAGDLSRASGAHAELREAVEDCKAELRRIVGA